MKARKVFFPILVIMTFLALGGPGVHAVHGAAASTKTAPSSASPGERLDSHFEKAKEYIQEQINADVEVVMYGQELNEQTYAIAKSDVLIMGENAENIRQGNSFTQDKFKGQRFSYMLSNPPFGVSWKKEPS